MRKIAGAFALACLVACGSVGSNPKDPDAGPPLDAPDPIDAPDAAPPLATGTVRELDSAGGHLTGGGLVLDVQIGHPIAQHATTGGGLVLTGGVAVKP